LNQVKWIKKALIKKNWLKPKHYVHKLKLNLTLNLTLISIVKLKRRIGKALMKKF
jgi:hypothetical protein